MDVPGVPETIPRAAFVALIESLGLDPNNLRTLEFGPTCITAEVYALTPEGKRYVDTSPGREGDVALHRLTIPVVG